MRISQRFPLFGEKRCAECAKRLSQYGEVFPIGKSVFGRDILCVKLGSGRPHVVCVAGHHAREHLSSECLYRALLSLMEEKIPFGGTVFAVLSANPDGAELCINGLPSAPESAREFLLSVNSGSEDFSLYKANGRATDLNVNFPAKFGEGRGNVFCPSPQGYVGKYPLSEPENVALSALLNGVSADGLLTYHTKGEVIYWEFGQRGKHRKRDRTIAKQLASAGGFKLDSAKGSTGGLKDYAIEELGIPAFTVELGSDLFEHPLTYALAAGIAEQIKYFPVILSREIRREQGIFH